MNTSRYSDNQILSILKQTKNNKPHALLCREHRMNSATPYKCRGNPPIYNGTQK